MDKPDHPGLTLSSNTMPAFAGGKLNNNMQSTARKASLSEVNSIVGHLLALANSFVVEFFVRCS